MPIKCTGNLPEKKLVKELFCNRFVSYVLIVWFGVRIYPDRVFEKVNPGLPINFIRKQSADCRIALLLIHIIMYSLH